MKISTMSKIILNSIGNSGFEQVPGFWRHETARINVAALPSPRPPGLGRSAVRAALGAEPSHITMARRSIVAKVLPMLSIAILVLSGAPTSINNT